MFIDGDQKIIGAYSRSYSFDSGIFNIYVSDGFHRAATTFSVRNFFYQMNFVVSIYEDDGQESDSFRPKKLKIVFNFFFNISSL